ncbi:MAG: hypothetical protein JRJ85_15270 [Deltaproteobacteria bacterium]|nr:hypothetical protein [Deltaproteobacteria bacterium]
MALLMSMARRLARSKFGQNALAQPEALSFLKQKPTLRVYAGLIVVGFSFLFGLPVVALLGYLSVKMSEPKIIAVGGPVALVLAQVIRAVGIYLAGRNYAKEALLWLTRRFLEQYA